MGFADFNNAVSELSGLLRDHQRFGTYDSEVVRQVDRFYTKLFDLEPVEAPSEWDIYKMPGSKKLSEQLNLAVKKIVVAFNQLSVSDLKQVNKRSIFVPSWSHL